MQTVKFFDYSIFSSMIEEIDIKKPQIINTINPHSFSVAEYDLQFKKALTSSDVLLPDGIGIVYALKFLYNISIKRIAGYDLFEYVMFELNKSSGTCFFLGSTQNTLKKINDRAMIDFPNITVKSYSPPMKDYFSKKDSEIMIEKIKNSNCDVVFVGMTAPKQEKWVNKNISYFDDKFVCSVGAVFDFYARNIPRAPSIFIYLGLEWIYRSLISKRLFVRNFISNPNFLFLILIKYFRK